MMAIAPEKPSPNTKRRTAVDDIWTRLGHHTSSVNYAGQECFELRNPDGPEAAARGRELEARVAELERERDVRIEAWNEQGDQLLREVLNCNALSARVDELEKRLEYDPEIGEQGDGISCRDDTIKLQDARLDRYSARVAELEAENGQWDNLRQQLDLDCERASASVAYIAARYRAMLKGPTDD
jgi:hypothetical protein